MPPRVALAACAVVLAACAAPSSSLHSAAVPARTVEIDPALTDEVVGFTAELIRARAENPPGNEKRVVDIVAARLQEAGIDVVTAPFAGPDRVNLKAVVHGKDAHKPPFLLLGHSDVVPADAAEWTTPPYEGAIKGGKLIGRGAFDMLSMDALEALTLIALKRAETPPARDVIFVLEGDEEVDGKGMQAALVAWPELAHASSALTEGGSFVESALQPGENLAAVGVAEKGVFQFRLEAKGPSGHGSTPQKNAAPDRIVRAVARVLARDPPFSVTPPTARRLRDIGAAHGGVEGVLLGVPDLAAALVPGTVAPTPPVQALFHDTCALTMLEAGIKRNVIPGRASATFDCRLLPGTDPHAFRDRMLAVVDDPRVDLVVLNAGSANGSDPDGAVVDAVRARIKSEVPGAAVVTTLVRGATDCRFLRAAGVACYGFLPVLATKAELDGVHGKDESIRTAELERGLSRLVDITATLAQ